MRLAVKILPSWKNLLLAVLAAVLLVLAFPDFDLWFLAWFALVPLMWAVEREKESVARSFVLGWVFGTLFFFGTCWWLAYAPIHYARFPPVLAYSLVLVACLGAGVFPAIFAAILGYRLSKGSGMTDAIWIWIASEFLRYWLTGNNWNALGYSFSFIDLKWLASYGGIYAVSGLIVWANATIAIVFRLFREIGLAVKYRVAIFGYLLVTILSLNALGTFNTSEQPLPEVRGATVVAIQPNVPMSGVDQRKLEELRQRQFDLAESELKKLPTTNRQVPTTVILPESPMNFMYNDDREFQAFVRDFTTRNNVSLIFNSAEPDPTSKKYFNSAMMIGPDGKAVAQYDKIYLLPFGEAVPVPLESIVPAFVGNFSYGREYDLLSFGEAKGGIMICFESHFGQLSREYVRNGADVIIEMTNDGYLGPTPVLRQHLANAVFRAVETNRPVLRVTNVGVTAYITKKGQVLDPAPVYREDTRVWTVSKSDGSQTFYVRYGDWFAWLCSVVTVGLLLFGIARPMKKLQPQMNTYEHR